MCALPLTRKRFRLTAIRLRLSEMHSSTLSTTERVPLTSLQVQRAASMWRLQCEQQTLDDQLTDLQVVFRWLLQIHAGDLTTDLLRARAAYVAEMHAASKDLDAEIAELAKLHQDLITAELDRATALCMPRRRDCPGVRAPDPASRELGRRSTSTIPDRTCDV